MAKRAQKKQRKISIRLLRKGALIEETYTAFQHWRPGMSFKENLDRIEKTNIIGAPNESWLKEVVKTISSRFSGNEAVAPLVILARGGFDLESWKPCLLFHTGEIDALYYRFVVEWLFDKYESGAASMRTGDLIPFVRKITDGKIASGGSLSEYSVKRTARDLFHMAAVFGLISGRIDRQFNSYHLPDESFQYVLHAAAAREASANRIIQSPFWRLFLMTPVDVERALFRLHQHRRLEYHVAGSIAQLKLPFHTPEAFAREVAS